MRHALQAASTRIDLAACLLKRAGGGFANATGGTGHYSDF